MSALLEVVLEGLRMPPVPYAIVYNTIKAFTRVFSCGVESVVSDWKAENRNVDRNRQVAAVGMPCVRMRMQCSN